MEPADRALVPAERPVHPEFAVEHLTVDRGRATALVHDTVENVTATDTAEGRKFRTTDGTLVAILRPADGGERVDLHYRMAPPASTATLRARRLARAFRPFARTE